MDDKTAALLEKLADKLGTTSEHLWGVLTTQAQISGAVDLAVIVAATLAAGVATRIVWRKSSIGVDSEGRYLAAEWSEEKIFFARLAAGGLVLTAAALILTSAHSVASAFLNPEYWALKQVLGILR